MKKYLVLLSVVLASYTANAQFTFGVDGGLSMPGRGYGSSSDANFSNPSAGNINGYAKIGTCYDGFVGFKFIPILGVMAQYGVNFNSYDVGKLNNSSETVTTSGGDEISSYLIGPYLSFGAGGIKLEVKLLGGIVSSTYPTITESSTLGGTYTSVVNSFSTGDNFGYCAGAKLKFMAGHIVGIAIGVDYLASDATFKGTSSGYNTNVSQNYNMSVGVFQATLGLSIDI